MYGHYALFLGGVVVGIGLTVCVFLWLLSIKSFTRHEEHTLEAELKVQKESDVLVQAINSLQQCLSTGRSNHYSDQDEKHNATKLHADNHISASKPLPQRYELIDEAQDEYSRRCKEVKLRLKDSKEASQFFSDLAKCYVHTGKELGKLATVALKYKESDQELRECGLDSNDLTLPSARWRMIGIYLNSASQDCESLSTLINSGIAPSASRLVDELTAVDKKLSNEGAKLIGRMRECATLFELRGRERDTAVRKKDTVGIVGPDLERRLAKVQQTEEALADAETKLLESQYELLATLPKVSADLYTFISLKARQEIQSYWKLMARKLDSVCAHTTKNVLRLGAQLSKSSNVEHEEHLLQFLEKCLSHDSDSKPTIDMSLESTCTLASSALSALPDLPQDFSQAIGTETCVWFMAFIGRVYRDCVQSDFFQSWACSRFTHALNKGSRPSCIDELTVTKVEFGSLPPILTNVRWIPSNCPNEESPDYNVTAQSDIVFRSGITFYVETKVCLNRAIGAWFAIKLQVELVEMIGQVNFGCAKTSSHIQFTSDPYCVINVSSQIGDAFSLKDLPSLSDFIVQKVRRSIRNRLVQPNKHIFRLIWPRNWWPAGATDTFQPAQVPGQNAESRVNQASNPAPSSRELTNSSIVQDSHTLEQMPSKAIEKGSAAGSRTEITDSTGLTSKLSSWARIGQSRLRGGISMVTSTATIKLKAGMQAISRERVEGLHRAEGSTSDSVGNDEAEAAQHGERNASTTIPTEDDDEEGYEEENSGVIASSSRAHDGSDPSEDNPPYEGHSEHVIR